MNQLLFDFLYRLASEHHWVEMVAVFSATYLGWIALAWIVLMMIWRGRDDERAGGKLFFILATGGAAWLASCLLKYFLTSPRPFLVIKDLVPLINVETSNSFPSGHTSFFFALALAVYVIDQRLGRWLIAVALLVAWGRVAVGVHWPLDILGGFALAIFISAIAVFVARLINLGFGHHRS